MLSRPTFVIRPLVLEFGRRLLSALWLIGLRQVALAVHLGIGHRRICKRYWMSYCIGIFFCSQSCIISFFFSF